MTTAAPAYPISVEANPPARQNRWTVFFRLVMAVPHMIIMSGTQGALNMAQVWSAVVAWFAILFTGRYPRTLYRFSVGAQLWNTRVNGYLLLLSGAFPPFGIDPEDPYPVRFAVAPEIENRNRLTTFFRLFMAIPHIIVLVFLGIAAAVVLLIAWFAALFTGSVPVGLHGFLEGVLRWGTRVQSYLYLFTDQYPPFALS